MKVLTVRDAKNPDENYSTLLEDSCTYDDDIRKNVKKILKIRFNFGNDVMDYHLAIDTNMHLIKFRDNLFYFQISNFVI